MLADAIAINRTLVCTRTGNLHARIVNARRMRWNRALGIALARRITRSRNKHAGRIAALGMLVCAIVVCRALIHTRTGNLHARTVLANRMCRVGNGALAAALARRISCARNQSAGIAGTRGMLAGAIIINRTLVCTRTGNHDAGIVLADGMDRRPALHVGLAGRGARPVNQGA